MAIDFRADPVGQRIKGWVPKGPGQVKLVPGWEPRPEYGAGQMGAGDDWYLDPSMNPQVTQPADQPNPVPDATVTSTPAPAPAATPPHITRQSPTPAPAAAPAAAGASTASAKKPAAKDTPAAPSQPSQSQSDFVSSLEPYARSVSARTGIPWQVLLAIPANETGWGQAVFHNNYFGIKGPGASAATWEVVNGQRQDIVDSFKTFDSAEASMQGFAQFLNDNPRYATALKDISANPNDWPTFVKDLQQAGYATDPQWADKVISIGERIEGNTGDMPLGDQAQRTGVTSVNSPRAQRTSAVARQSQFSLGLSTGDAYAFCGPAAAIAFAQTYGRNPTVSEAKALAQSVGWTPDQGMAGAGSEVSLLNKMGVAAHMTTKIDWNEVRDDASNGNPVIIDTPGHYFYVDGYDTRTGKYHLGTSASDLIASHGQEWFTSDQIAGLGMGSPRAAIFADNPLSGQGNGTAADSAVRASDGTVLGANTGRTTPTKRRPAAMDTTKSLTFQQAMDQYNRDQGNPMTLATPPGTTDATTTVGGGQEAEPEPEPAPEPKQEQSTAGSPLEQALMQMVEQVVSKRMGAGAGFSQGQGMGAGDDWYSDPTINQPVADASGNLDIPDDTAARAQAAAVDKVVATPGMGYQVPTTADANAYLAKKQAAQTQTNQAALTQQRRGEQLAGYQATLNTPGEGYQVPTNADVTNAQNAAQYTADQANIQNESQFLSRQQHPAAPAGTTDASATATTDQPVTDPSFHIGDTARKRATALPLTSGTSAVPPQPALPQLDQPVGNAPIYTQQQNVQRLQMTAATGATIASLAVPPIAGEVLGGVAGTALGSAAVGAAAGVVQQAPDIVQHAWNKDADGLAADAAVVGFSALIPGGGKVASNIAGKVASKAGELAPLVAPIAQQLLDSPVGRIMAEDALRQPAQATTGFALQLAKPTAVGAAIGGTYNAVADINANGFHPQDTSWDAKVASDFITGAKYGGGLGLTLGITYMLGKYGWDKSNLPENMAQITGDLGQLKNVETLKARDTLGTRLGEIRRGRVTGEAVLQSGLDTLGAHGTGMNTLDAAMYMEDHGSLNGYIGPNGEIPTADQVAWYDDRHAYETQANARLQAVRALSPTQDVVTPPGMPGPKTHLFHMSENDYRAQAALDKRGNRGEGLSWSTGVTHQRAKTLDPTIDPETPRTLREQLAAWQADQALPEAQRDPLANYKPVDSAVLPYAASAEQTERAIANKKALNAILTDRGVAWYPSKGNPAPEGWVDANPRWMGPVTSRQALNLSRYKIAPYTARALDVQTGVEKGWAEHPIYRFLQDYVNAPEKLITFAGSPVHGFNIATRVATSIKPSQTVDLLRNYILPGMKPGGFRKMFLANPSVFENAAAANVLGGRVAADDTRMAKGAIDALKQSIGSGFMGFSAGWTQAKLRGESDTDALRDAWIGGAIGAAPLVPFGTAKLDNGAAVTMASVVHKAIFERAIPLASVGMHDILTRAGMDTMQAGEYVNQTLGMVDTLKMARAPWVQDLIRLTALAPAHEESILRMVGNAAFGSGQVGKASRVAMISTLAAFGGTLEAFNILFNQHPTWENEQGREYELETTGLLGKMAQMSGQDWLIPRKADGTPQRVYADISPLYRPIFQTLGELSRSGGEQFGRFEQGVGGMFGDQGAVSAGQTLQRVSEGDPSQGQTPPNLPDSLATLASSRTSGLLRAAGGIRDMVGSVVSPSWPQTDWTGKPYDPPHIGNNTSWLDAWDKIARTAGSLEPASAGTAQRAINVQHPEQSLWGDALINFLGFARVARETDVADQQAKQDAIKQWGGVGPRDQANDKVNLQNAQRDLDQQQTDFFAGLGAGGKFASETGAGIDKWMHDQGVKRQEESTKVENNDSIVMRFPTALQPAIKQFFDNSSEAVVGSQNAADVPNGVDLKALSDSYWNATGARDPTNPDEAQRVRNYLIQDTADTHDSSFQSLEDYLKWEVQNKDLSTGAVPPVPTLPGMTTDDLSKVTTGYLKAGEDDAGNQIADPVARADAQRAYIDAQAGNYSVDRNNLLQRIHLRLSPMRPMSPAEQSYQTALRVFFESRDTSSHPQYLNADGTPMGTPADWNGPHGNDGWNAELSKAGIKTASRSEDLAPLLAAKQRGDSARRQDLLKNLTPTEQTAYERMFGLGRNMSTDEWNKYIHDQVNGYYDLQGQKGVPAYETFNRDRIIEQYTASTPIERATTMVKFWDPVSRQTTSAPLALVHKYLTNPKVHINSAGRELDQQQIADAATQDPASGDQSATGVQ